MAKADLLGPEVAPGKASNANQANVVFLLMSVRFTPFAAIKSRATLNVADGFGSSLETFSAITKHPVHANLNVPPRKTPITCGHSPTPDLWLDQSPGHSRTLPPKRPATVSIERLAHDEWVRAARGHSEIDI